MPIKPKDVNQYLQNGCGRCKLGGTLQCKARTWRNELRLLREIILESELVEEIKWNAPCYTNNGRNILMLSALKDSVVVSFFRGAEMSDPDNILVKPGENSRFTRYIRVIDTQSIASLRQTIPSYIQEAIGLEHSGKKVEPREGAPLAHPEELVQLFKTNPEFEKAFAALTPGRQRGYVIHFSSAKQSNTKIARIKKCMPKIFQGKGWNER